MGLPDVMMQGVEQYTSYFDETTSKTRRLSWQVRGGFRACCCCGGGFRACCLRPAAAGCAGGWLQGNGRE